MKLIELLYWLEAGHGVRGIPQTDASKCPRGLLINITDLDDVKALKTAKSLMPTYADVTVVKLGDPTPEPIEKVEQPAPPVTIREATAPKAEIIVEDQPDTLGPLVDEVYVDSGTTDIASSVDPTDTVVLNGDGDAE